MPGKGKGEKKGKGMSKDKGKDDGKARWNRGGTVGSRKERGHAGGPWSRVHIHYG